MSKLLSKLLGFVSSVEENSDSDEDESTNDTSDDTTDISRAWEKPFVLFQFIGYSWRPSILNDNDDNSLVLLNSYFISAGVSGRIDFENILGYWIDFCG